MLYATSKNIFFSMNFIKNMDVKKRSPVTFEL